MICPSCGKNNYGDALFCSECSSHLGQPPTNGPSYGEPRNAAAPGPFQGGGAQAFPTLLPGLFNRTGGLFGWRSSRNIHYPTWFLVACGGMIFAITIIAILIAAAAWRAAHVPVSTISIVADNSGAESAARNDHGLLLIKRPGDSWTFTFNRDNVDGMGVETISNGQIVQQTGRASGHSRPLLVDTSVLSTSKPSGQAISNTYVTYSSQSSDRSMYLLGYSDARPNRLHWNDNAELVAKGDWNADPSFDIDTETITGGHSHTYVTVQPEPVLVKLSNGTPIKCWNRTVTVVADNAYSETSTDVFCPAIDANISSTDVITYNAGAKRTTTTYLTHYSLAN